MNWLPFLDLSTLLAQTPAPSDSPASVELLRQQIEFLTRENARQTAEFTEKLKLITDENKTLSESFKNFISTMQFALVGFAALSAGITGAIAYIFKTNLDDAKQVAKDGINQRVDAYMSDLLDSKLEVVRRTLQKEEVISSTLVDYCLLSKTAVPTEFELLNGRGFRSVRLRQEETQLRRSSAQVVVLDLENWVNGQGLRFPTLPEGEREQTAKQQVDVLLDILPIEVVLVVYVRSTVKYLFSVPKDRYVSPANNPITLVGMVTDAAYVAAGMKGLS
ncbi:hypothetical protein ACKFKG_30585 [Phormidesmis sp. 146-35]